MWNQILQVSSSLDSWKLMTRDHVKLWTLFVLEKAWYGKKIPKVFFPSTHLQRFWGSTNTFKTPSNRNSHTLCSKSFTNMFSWGNVMSGEKRNWKKRKNSPPWPLPSTPNTYFEMISCECFFLHAHRETRDLSGELPKEDDQYRFLRDVSFTSRDLLDWSWSTFR